jgi:hypothetical protein
MKPGGAQVDRLAIRWDIEGINVRSWHSADIDFDAENIRFRGQSGHPRYNNSCPLMTLNGQFLPAPERAGR